MNYLDEIIENVKTKGKHEESWVMLKNPFFRGDDAQEKVKECASYCCFDTASR